MKTFGNIIWFILGGFICTLLYWIIGLIMCLTIIGIPFGVQLFKIGRFVLSPFGHDLVAGPNNGGCINIIFNVLWILLGWWEVALTHLSFGFLLCITIIGIPFGVQHFKIAIGTILPFGKEVI